MANERTERALRGLEAARARGSRIGAPEKVSDAQIIKAMRLGTMEGARKVGLSKSQFILRRARLEQARGGPQA